MNNLKNHKKLSIFAVIFTYENLFSATSQIKTFLSCPFEDNDEKMIDVVVDTK